MAINLESQYGGTAQHEFKQACVQNVVDEYLFASNLDGKKEKLNVLRALAAALRPEVTKECFKALSILISQESNIDLYRSMIDILRENAGKNYCKKQNIDPDIYWEIRLEAIETLIDTGFSKTPLADDVKKALLDLAIEYRNDMKSLSAPPPDQFLGWHALLHSDIFPAR